MASQQRLAFLGCGRCLFGGRPPAFRWRRFRGSGLWAGVWVPVSRPLPGVRPCPSSCPFVGALPELPLSEFQRVWEAEGAWEAWSWLVWSVVAWLGC